MKKCVYVHLIDNKPVYVGSGSSKRPLSKQHRSESHLLAFSLPNFTIKVIADNLTEIDAKNLEQKTIDLYKNNGHKLFNRANTTCQTIPLDREHLSKYVEYSKESPTSLLWVTDTYSGRNNTRMMRRVGDFAGSILNSRGYSTISICGVKYQVHRIIWVLHHGEIPEQMAIDHIDGNRSNNSIENLRCTTYSINAKNKKHKFSNTGFQSISESIDNRCISNAGNFIISWTEDLYLGKTKVFRYGPKSRTRCDAFDLALKFRNSLIDIGIIQIKEGIL